MNIDWWSQKGLLRRSNNDFAAVNITETRLTAIIVDAAEKGPDAQAFARYWACSAVDKVAQRQGATVVSALREVHRTLVPHYLHELASYALLDFDRVNRTGSLFSVGDCRLGIENASGVKWINPPHNLTAFLPDRPEDGRHCLTRSLKARRFTVPEAFHFSQRVGERLILCTDGYWTRQQAQSYEDDISRLVIEDRQSEVSTVIHSEDDNFYHRVSC